jgi:uncharacterized protein
MMNQYQYLTPLLGGALIGLSASVLWLTLGRVAGVSGILGSTITRSSGDVSWRLGFLVGLIGIGALTLSSRGAGTPVHSGPVVLVVAGLLVGMGTRLGNGCTSGHGVCGLSRLSPRSAVATAVFLATAMLVVFAVRHWIGGTP